MNFQKYYRNGWGLHPKTIEFIFNIIKNNEIKNIIEFGSGSSTEFFLDLNENFILDSFDHNPEFAYKNECVKIRDLIYCNDNDYDYMFENKVFNKNAFQKTNDILNTRIKNATYDIHDDDLNENYNLVLIDGPNGNGRNFSYFYLKDRLKSGSYIIIDDYFHYDFLEKCQLFFDYEVLDLRKFPEDHPNKGHAILRII